MIVDRETINKKVTEIVLTLDKPGRKKAYDELEEKYGIPVDISSDIISMRTGCNEYDDFIMFAMLDTLANKYIVKYYTQTEIDNFRKTKYVVEKLNFPLIFGNMCKVSSDQWIGSISARELMKLKNAHIIRYNENTQRTLTKIVRGENKYFKITLNKKSVNQIKELFSSNSYIPDDITLNIPETADFIFSDGKLIINSTDFLDIIDGYHRYIAISQIFNTNHDFDYEMELRIVSFSQEKARQFIFQKDQKTHMRQVDAKSMDQYDPANMVIERLNMDPLCDIHGMIANNGKIDYSYLAGNIRFYYFNEKRKYTTKEVVSTKETLKQKFNQFFENEPSYFDHDFNNSEIAAIMYVFANFDHDIHQPTMQLLSKIGDIKAELFYMPNDHTIRRKLINTFDKILEEWEMHHV